MNKIVEKHAYMWLICNLANFLKMEITQLITTLELISDNRTYDNYLTHNEPNYLQIINYKYGNNPGGGLNDLRVDTMITKWEFEKSERTNHPPPT